MAAKEPQREYWPATSKKTPNEHPSSGCVIKQLCANVITKATFKSDNMVVLDFCLPKLDKIIIIIVIKKDIINAALREKLGFAQLVLQQVFLFFSCCLRHIAVNMLETSKDSLPDIINRFVFQVCSIYFTYLSGKSSIEDV